MATPKERGPLTGYYIWRLSLKWRAAVDRALAPLELTHAEYALLGSLARLSQGGGRPSQRELADFSGLEPMYVSKLARTLEEDGLLAREANLDDPRAFCLSLTEKGRAMLDASFAKVYELHNRLMAPLGEPGDGRRAEFKATLETLLRHAEVLDAPLMATTHPEEE
jgi:DNA-binding MarR family transcriptional regulator